MKIMGISGFGNAMSFKQRELPKLNLREYRIVQGQDSAATLLVDGEVVAAAAEERFNGAKHTGDFPVGAMEYCAAEAGIALEDVDEFVHDFDYALYKSHYSLNDLARRRYAEVYSRDAILKEFRKHLPQIQDPAARLHHVEHHLAHAASAYYGSGWDECLVVVLDGMGEVHSNTVWHARDGELHSLYKQDAGHSIGVLYSLTTLHLGFDFNSDEYKIMGLAPYGDPERFRPFFDEHVRFTDDGGISIPILQLNRTPEQRETYESTREFLSKALIEERDPDDEITDDHRDVAASLQACLNRTILHICTHFAKSTGQRRLAMAGGVALNCTANGKLLYSGHFEDIFVQPAAGDDGASLGAALARAAEHGEVRNERMPVPYLGPAYTQERVEAALAKYGDEIEVTRFASTSETCVEAARQIAAGSVIAWSRGRMEFGARALGNRSILADPSNPEMRDRVNAMVKKREAFRPFAPAVTLESVSEWFELEPGSVLPYMVVIVNVREAHREGLPGITHVDGTARVQTVSQESNAVFHELLKAVGNNTGKEMVLNTSFNVKGQPMVNTPEEALETFLGTGIDSLFLENVLVQRRTSQGS